MARQARPVWTLDCETDPFKADRTPKPFIWGLYDGENDDYYEYVAEYPAQLINFIREKRILIYAHNGGKFDYHYLRDDINSDQPLMVINGRIACAKIGEAEIRDSINILPVALKTFAKDDIDYSIMEREERDKPENRGKISAYLRSDCVHLYEFISRYQADYGKGLTQAGAAMRYWTRTSGIKAPKQTAGQFDLLKEFYYGGRVQAFVSGHVFKKFDVYDINSAYPYAMKFKHPFSTVAIHDDHLPADGKIAQSFIELECISRGAFPWRDETGRTYYPDDGKVRVYKITGWEFIAGVELAAVDSIQIRTVYRFDLSVTFEEYIDHFYNLRKKAKVDGDKARDIFAKLLMNSLYGKFGSDPSQYKEWVLTHEEKIAEWIQKGFVPSVRWGERDLLSRPLPEAKHRYYNIATAASITGFVRAMLFRALKGCQEILYCDTDSIAACGFGGLSIGGELGQWKHELTGDEYGIAGKKLYAFRKEYVCPNVVIGPREYKIACKGAKLTPQEIIEVSEGKTITYRPEVPTYSIQRPEPIFFPREISSTYRDMRLPP